jgi:membrane-associated phospholipid phosphatase
MHFGVVILGSVTALLGILLMIYGSRSRGEMDSRLGKIKSPIWFLAIIIGISTTVIGFLLT